MIDTTRIPVTTADRETARMTLRAIATYAGMAREQVHRRPDTVDDVLRHIEQHALEVLDGCHAPQPALVPVALVAARPGEQRWPIPLTPARCAALLRDPPLELQRVPIVDVLSMVPALGPHGARRLLRQHHVAHRTWLGARSWERIADELTTETVR